MTLQLLMRDFGDLAEIEDIQLDADGVAKINIDGVVVAFMENESGRLVTWAAVGDLPQEGGDKICRRLMAESLLGIATDGAALTLDEETGKVMIHRIDPLDGLDLKGFVGHLNAFLEMRAKWAAALAGESADDESDGSSDFIRV